MLAGNTGRHERRDASRGAGNNLDRHIRLARCLNQSLAGDQHTLGIPASHGRRGSPPPAGGRPGRRRDLQSRSRRNERAAWRCLGASATLRSHACPRSRWHWRRQMPRRRAEDKSPRVTHGRTDHIKFARAGAVLRHINLFNHAALERAECRAGVPCCNTLLGLPRLEEPTGSRRKRCQLVGDEHALVGIAALGRNR